MSRGSFALIASLVIFLVSPSAFGLGKQESSRLEGKAREKQTYVSPNKEVRVDVVNFPRQPAELTIVSDLSAPNWLKSLRIRFQNNSGRVVQDVEIGVILPEVVEAGLPYKITLSGRLPANHRLRPNFSLYLGMPDDQMEVLEAYLNRRGDVGALKIAKVVVEHIRFDQGDGFVPTGFYEKDGVSLPQFRAHNLQHIVTQWVPERIPVDVSLLSHKGSPLVDGIGILIRNNSSKPISRFTMRLVLPEVKNPEGIRYGLNFDLSDQDRKQKKHLLRPGESARIFLSDRQVRNLKGYLERNGKPSESLSRAELIYITSSLDPDPADAVSSPKDSDLTKNLDGCAHSSCAKHYVYQVTCCGFTVNVIGRNQSTGFCSYDCSTFFDCPPLGSCVEGLLYPCDGFGCGEW